MLLTSFTSSLPVSRIEFLSTRDFNLYVDGRRYCVSRRRLMNKKSTRNGVGCVFFLLALLYYRSECNHQLDREILEEAWTGNDSEELKRQQTELYATMRIVYKIRSRSSKNDNLFEPLVETAHLLKKYQVVKSHQYQS